MTKFKNDCIHLFMQFEFFSFPSINWNVYFASSFFCVCVSRARGMIFCSIFSNHIIIFGTAKQLNKISQILGIFNMFFFVLTIRWKR